MVEAPGRRGARQIVHLESLKASADWVAWRPLREDVMRSKRRVFGATNTVYVGIHTNSAMHSALRGSDPVPFDCLRSAQAFGRWAVSATSGGKLSVAHFQELVLLTEPCFIDGTIGSLIHYLVDPLFN
jgi:hypothetical protein